MKITKLHLYNFKRFTKLTITEIPDSTKLVLVIGSNGSFFKENEFAKLLRTFKGNYRGIIDLLSSGDFETFYKVFPAKDYGNSIPERQNIHRRDLAKTNWFKQIVKSVIENGSI